MPATTSPITRGWPSLTASDAEQARHEHARPPTAMKNAATRCPKDSRCLVAVNFSPDGGSPEGVVSDRLAARVALAPVRLGLVERDQLEVVEVAVDRLRLGARLAALRALDVAGDGALLLVVGERAELAARRAFSVYDEPLPVELELAAEAGRARRELVEAGDRAGGARLRRRRRRADRASGRRRSAAPPSVPGDRPLVARRGRAVELLRPAVRRSSTSPVSGASRRRSRPPRGAACRRACPACSRGSRTGPTASRRRTGPRRLRLRRRGRGQRLARRRAPAAAEAGVRRLRGRSRRRSTAGPSCPRPPMTTMAVTTATATARNT